MSLPLILPKYYLDVVATVQVTITENYDTAQVVFACEGASVHEVILTQEVPSAVLPDNLVLEDFTILRGELIMQVPSESQPGTIMFECAYTYLNSSDQALHATVAIWNIDKFSNI